MDDLDADFFQWLEENACRVRDREQRSVAHIVRRSAELKRLLSKGTNAKLLVYEPA